MNYWTAAGVTKNFDITTTINMVSNYYKIPKAKILGRKRTKEISEARQVVWYFLTRRRIMTYEELGKIFNRNHATALHGVRKIEGYVEFNKDFAEKIRLIRASSIDYFVTVKDRNYAQLNRRPK